MSAADLGFSALLIETERALGCAHHILDEYRGGMPVAEIAKRYRANEAVVSWWCAIAGLEPPYSSDPPMSLIYFDASVRFAQSRQRSLEREARDQPEGREACRMPFVPFEGDRS